MNENQKNQWITEIEEISNVNPQITFSAEGFCPAENEGDDLTGSGHYWTQWPDLSAEELIDKLKDNDYIIEKWNVNELEQDQNNKNTHSAIIDIPSENRSENQVCNNCKKPNPFGDLLCNNCYKEIDKQHDRIYEEELE